MDSIAANPKTWEKVLRKVRAGEMPPPTAPMLDPGAAATLIRPIETELDRAALAKPNPGTPSIHRLNRAEYSNAVRDLLALEADQLPASLPARRCRLRARQHG